MPRYVAPPEAEPMREMNTTPLIDVMLVLLIMFLIALPVLTHKVPLNLPLPGPAEGAPPPDHTLAIAPSGALSWDGQTLPAAALPGRLEAMAADPARPRLVIDASSEARYERVDEVLAAVNRAGVTQVGFADNARFARAF
ncbi:MAG: ExbD/TolR family protein [Parasphingopyxis sp.]|uniref:ExbD/TolR family protein n=1 Tax=Parasphingopyxis sp. TaxID=1920299 RepID=UPI003F9ED2B1